MACVPGLIGPLTAPNGILRASPGRELRGGIDSGPGFAPEARTRAEMSGYPGRVGPAVRTISGFSQNGPEWLGKALGVLFGGPGEQQIKKCLGLGQDSLEMGFSKFQDVSQNGPAWSGKS